MRAADHEVAHRNSAFHAARQPLQHYASLRLDTNRTTGPVSFLNPTRARLEPTSQFAKSTDSLSKPTDTQRDAAIAESKPPFTYKWTSRNNRKGRHAISINPNAFHSEANIELPKRTASVKQTLRGIRRMVTVFPVWDISYDVATIFTLGSVVWVINAFFVWLPLASPDSEFKNEELYGGGITAFIGATIFEVGSILLILEAVNENRTGCFGWALDRALSQETEEHSSLIRLQRSTSICTHHHPNKRKLVGKEPNVSENASTSSTASNTRSWSWFPSKSEIRDHYIHELGFLASFVQLLAATIFWVSGFTALPGIYDHMSRPITIVFYWTPQVIGGTGFIISGALFMLETQSRWNKPAFGTLGWWIGAWNLIGGIGFTLCPAFGYDESSWAQYQACLSTFWGSWAFLIGSVIQWYESMGKHPVDTDTGLS